jgi:hypothetical protein
MLPQYKLGLHHAFKLYLIIIIIIISYAPKLMIQCTVGWEEHHVLGRFAIRPSASAANLQGNISTSTKEITEEENNT